VQERVAWRHGAALAVSVAALVAGGAACSKGRGSAPEAKGGDAAPLVDPAAVARAEDRRRALDVPEASRVSRDVAVRRAAVRALARIADPASDDALLRALADEDPETAAWAAYGLGFTCKGREEAHVRALAARRVSLGDGAASTERSAVDPRAATARAIGRCGGATAERVLSGWVRARGAWGERAAYALGDLTARAKVPGATSDETTAALVGAATAGADGPPLDAALYPFSRMEHAPPAFAARVLGAARGALAVRTPTRIFAVRALGRCGGDAVPDLSRIVVDRQFTPAEREEAARGLARLGDDGWLAAATALAQVTPDPKDPFAVAALAGDEYGVMIALVTALAGDPPKELPRRVDSSLYALASLTAPGTAPPALARRIATLRCGAAGALARGAYDAEVLRKCDAEGSEASERARLAALVRRPLVGERRAAWRGLTRSLHVRVREAALEAIADHAELGDVARAALVDALATKKGGIVATAAEVMHAHPDRVQVLADSEKRAALDPAAAAPVPGDRPARVLDRDIEAALDAALAKPWTEDLIETRAALLDAAVAVGLPRARDAATAACHDVNVTMRDRAARALRLLGNGGAGVDGDGGDAAPVCAAPSSGGGGAGGDAAPEVGHALGHPTRVTFQTDGGQLAIVFEPDLAPVATARFVSLARAGFYNGIVVHRVVPGFVAQFGDPDGDGFGGAGSLLRCETSPVPFGALDVGVALSGRDTGSSQLFVTLARYPHLDGEYARVGRAEGDWAALAEGDSIREVKVEE
jgi:cyclophilin family peptidyl-prolyl cis-trans isomerase